MEGFLIVAPERTWPPDYWDQIADLHKSEIRAGFLSSLDRRFLAGLYAAVGRSDKGILLAATCAERHKVVGFICGSTDPRGLMTDCMLRSGLRLVFPLLREILSWRTVVRIFETVKYAGGNGGQSFPRAEILNFCVGADFQRLGIGRRLFASLAQEFKRRGVQRIRIVTGESQAAAQSFYDAAHAQRAGSVNIHGDAGSVVFLYEID